MKAVEFSTPRLHDRYSSTLQSAGTVLLPPFAVFSAEEVAHIGMLQSALPEERVRNGDAGDKHDLFVRRIMLDAPGELPTVVAHPNCREITNILADDTRQSLFGDLFSSSERYYIRRCQVNRLVAGSFIGVHLDAASNPDYEFALTIQLSRSFEGGEFVVYPTATEQQILRVAYGAVLVTTCHFTHEVWPVTSGERTTLVYFLSRHAGRNRRSM